MKTAIVISILLLGSVTYGKTEKSRTKLMGAQLETEHMFNDLSVVGRRQSAFEARATIENEKVLHDLIDYRTHYNDRLKKMTEQE